MQMYRNVNSALAVATLLIAQIAWLVSGGELRAAEQSKPNILVIWGDDIGWEGPE